MKVIFLKDVPKVGNKYDVKEFSEGYANNVLINKGLAIRATPSELAKIDAMREKSKKLKEIEKEEFNLLVEKARGISITVAALANEKGHLFSALGKKDVVLAVQKATGMQIDEGSIDLGHIKELGAHTVTIKKGKESGNFTVTVIKQ
jgi:large subunit ribosomal protein L9